MDASELPTADTSSSIVELMQFLKENQWKNVGQLQVAQFPETGRGIRTIRSRDFAADEALIDMPFGSTFISLITLMADKGFQRHCLGGLADSSVGTQLLLTVYSLYQKHLGDKSKWRAYINSLPDSLSTPHFCLQSELDCVPMVRSLVEKSVQGVISAFENCFSSSTCECCGHKLLDLIDKDELILMYYLVNSRSVYCDPRIIRNNCESLEFLSDEPNMALAPFLDLFNHSDQIDTESLLYLDSSSKLRYQLVTKTHMKCTDQLFINYGHHCNFKLLMEYGFIIENNRYEKIDLSLDQIGDFIRSYPKFYHAKKMAFVKGRAEELASEVFISVDGLSYNLETILKIFKSAGLTEKSLSELVYSKSTLPVDETVNLEKELYSYLIVRFDRAQKALQDIERLTEGGKLLSEFLRQRIKLLDKLVAQIDRE